MSTVLDICMDLYISGHTVHETVHACMEKLSLLLALLPASQGRLGTDFGTSDWRSLVC